MVRVWGISGEKLESEKAQKNAPRHTPEGKKREEAEASSLKFIYYSV